MDFSEKIIGKENYFNSAVLALMVKNNGEYYLLFEKRAQNIRQGGEISFPGGKVEKSDKNSMETALRESFEEIGLGSKDIEIKGKIGTLVIPTGVLVEAYLAYGENIFLKDLKLNFSEVEECFMVPLKFFLENKPRLEKLKVETHPYYEENGNVYKFPAKELDLPERYFKSWSGNPRKVYIYVYENRVIWGLTAEIIMELLKYIREEGIENLLK
ncbi:NUDIX hydrolase [Cetobacterium sp. SF1]|uniref:NUDIX hydrolase n=1 Tax=Cetobacterium sp. SF1 TaxID=3417654 RepID=UPI003CF831C0